MAVNYSLVKQAAKVGDSKSTKKFYARAQVAGTTSLKQISKMVSSQTTVSRADVYAVLISMVDNLMEELKRGNQVEMGDLGKFRVQIQSEGTEKADTFTSTNNIKGVNIQFVPGDELKNIFNDLEFTPVASRVVQKAALKAEKLEEKTLDIEAVKNAKKKANVVVTPAEEGKDSEDGTDADNSATEGDGTEGADTEGTGSENAGAEGAGSEGSPSDNAGAGSTGGSEV